MSVRSFADRLTALDAGEPLITQHPKRLRAFREELRAVEAAVRAQLAATEFADPADAHGPSLFDAIIPREQRTIDACCWLVATPLDIVRAHLWPLLPVKSRRALAMTCRHFARVFFSRITQLHVRDQSAESLSRNFVHLDWAPLSSCTDIQVIPTSAVLEMPQLSETEFDEFMRVAAKLHSRANPAQCRFVMFVSPVQRMPSAVWRREVPPPFTARPTVMSLQLIGDPGEAAAWFLRSPAVLSAVTRLDISRVHYHQASVRACDVRYLLADTMVPRMPALRRVRLLVDSIPFNCAWIRGADALELAATPQWVDGASLALDAVGQIRFDSITVLGSFLERFSPSAVATTWPGRLLLCGVRGAGIAIETVAHTPVRIFYTPRCATYVKTRPRDSQIEWVPSDVPVECDW